MLDCRQLAQVQVLDPIHELDIDGDRDTCSYGFAGAGVPATDSTLIPAQQLASHESHNALCSAFPSTKDVCYLLATDTK